MSINELEKIGFDENKEFLPSFDRFKSKQSRRTLFMKFFNSQVQSEFRFNKAELLKYKNYNIKNIFVDKIDTLLNVNFTLFKYKQGFFLDKELTLSINKYINNTKNNPILSPKQNRVNPNKIKVAFNLLNMCFDGVKFQLKLDTNELFTEFVFNKIKRVNQDKFTSKCDNCIDIISSCSTTTKVFTYWEFLNKQDLDINHAVNRAVDTVRTTQFNQIYLVYPKHDTFDKHIQIKSKELEVENRAYDIKVIPYSLRSILR